VPDLVRSRVIEDHALALAPGDDRIADLHAAALGLRRYLQAEVHSHEALEDAAMARHVRTGRENREEGRRQPGHAGEQPRRRGAARAIFPGAMSETIEKERPPAITLADRRLIGRDILKARQSLALQKQRVELAPNQRS